MFAQKCYHCPSTDVIGLCDVGGSRPDLRPACERHSDETLRVVDIITDLSEQQRGILEESTHSAVTQSGRGGHRIQTMRALERRRMLRLDKEHANVTDWRFTSLGFFIGERLARVRLDKQCQLASTKDLKDGFADAQRLKAHAILAELEIRGWRWDFAQHDWTRDEREPDWKIVEGISGTFHYHLQDGARPSSPSKRLAICGAHVMTTQLPLTAWGKSDHLVSRWCKTCAARADFPPTSP